MSEAYEAAGVNIEAGYEAVARIRKHVARTMRPEVMTGLGGFGALFDIANSPYEHPVLVSGTDGVGTKILLAQQTNQLDTIGIDAVAMCANDILAQGAEPLFFLDYLAVGKNEPKQIEQIVSGIAEGCTQAGVALIGGETAEMPDLYSEQEFDLAGFCVGIGDRDYLLDGSQVKAGDRLIGLPSSGIHSNGYSLVRKVFFKDHQFAFDERLEDGRVLIDHLLEPTKIYVKDVLPLVQKHHIHGIAHITGGSFYENVPRMLDDHLTAVIDTSVWERPFIFDKIQSLAGITSEEMFNIFNMGIGLVLAVDEREVTSVLDQIDGSTVIGCVQAREASDAQGIRLINLP